MSIRDKCQPVIAYVVSAPQPAHIEQLAEHCGVIPAHSAFLQHHHFFLPDQIPTRCNSNLYVTLVHCPQIRQLIALERVELLPYRGVRGPTVLDRGLGSRLPHFLKIDLRQHKPGEIVLQRFLLRNRRQQRSQLIQFLFRLLM